MIRSHHLGAIAERPQVVKRHEVKAEEYPFVCKHCGYPCKKTHGLGLCSACATFYFKYRQMRPRRLIEASATRRRKAKWCMTCGHPDIMCKQECKLCYGYRQRNGKPRPRWMWDDDLCCVNCDFPKKAALRRKNGRIYFHQDKCAACYAYHKRTGKERPEYLWGKGSKGWCSCGYPAEHQIDKINMCNRCVKEYR